MSKETQIPTLSNRADWINDTGYRLNLAVGLKVKGEKPFLKAKLGSPSAGTGAFISLDPKPNIPLEL